MRRKGISSIAASRCSASSIPPKCRCVAWWVSPISRPSCPGPKPRFTWTPIPIWPCRPTNSMGHAQEGDQLYRGQPLLSIFDPSEMQVRCMVGEPDIAAVLPGTKATVYLDAYPDLDGRDIGL